MKKFTFKSISVKVLTLALALCLGVAVVSFFGGKKAVAEEIAVDPSFALTQGASIRDGASAGDNYYGLRFETKFNQEWLDANPSSTYSFGTLIFPSTELGKFSAEENPTQNKENTKAIKYIHTANEEVNGEDTYYASVVYSAEYVEQIIPTIYPAVTNPNQTQIETVLNNLYVLDMTAISYAILDNGSIVYTEPYSDSMIKVAARLVSDEEYANLAKRYIKGEVTFGDAYVSKEDGILVVDSLEEEFVAGSYNQVIFSNQNLKAGVDYNVVDGDIDFADEFVANHIGEYHEVYFFNTNGDLLVVEVFFADKALNSAQDVYNTFRRGVQQLGETWSRNDNSYVLTQDVDMTGFTVKNNAIAAGSSVSRYNDNGDGTYTLIDTTTTTSDFGYGGVFDGRGHVISNVTMDLTNAGLGGLHIIKPDGTTGWINTQSFGFFTNLLKGGAVRNVAFINLKDNGTLTNGYGLTGLLGNYSDGVLENVYVDFNVNTIVTRGAFAQYGTPATVKNVVINFPRAEGYSIESHLEGGKAVFSYGSGSFGGQNSPLTLTANYENVFISSPMPINFYTSNASIANLQSVTYGENETKLHYDFGGLFAGLTLEEALALETGAQKNKVVKGVRRYDNMAEMAKDSVAKDALLATGYFKLVEGQLVWHNQTLQKQMANAVDFDASANVLYATDFELKDVKKVYVDNVEYSFTTENGALEILGVPTKTHRETTNQQIKVVVVTSEISYIYDTTYWTMLIDAPEELKSALCQSFATSNFGFYKLIANVDLNTTTYSHSDIASYVKNQNNEYAFAGIFDGNGFAIKNVKNSAYGIFGNFTVGASNYPAGNTTIKNLAIVNYYAPTTGTTGNYAVLGKYSTMNARQLVLENLYVSYADNSYVHGLIGYGQERVKMNNVLIDTNGNTIDPGNAALANKEYGDDVAGKAHVINATNNTDGGTLFGNFRLWGKVAESNALLTNVISYGKTPVVYQHNAGSNYSYFMNYDATAGKWVVKSTGWSYDGTLIIPYESFIGYANNEKVGFFPQAVGVKESFQKLGLTKYAVTAGYICTQCYDDFSLTAGETCDNCSVSLAYTGNIWSSPAILEWELVDVANYVNPTTTQLSATLAGSGTIKLTGVSKYNDSTEMVNAYTQDNNAFKSFTDVKVNGKQLWKVVNGVLMWHDNTVNHDCELSAPTCETPATCTICNTPSGDPLGHAYSETLTPNEDGTHSQVCLNDNSHVQTTACVYDQEVVEDKFVATHAGLGKHATYYYSCACGNKGEETFTVVGDIIVTDPIDYNAKTQRLETTFFGEATIDSVTVNGVEMTEGNDGLVHDIENGYYKLAGMPLIDNTRGTPTQDITLTIKSGEFTYILNNVTYWTIIIKTPSEVPEALDYDYATEQYNYGFYKLGNSIKALSDDRITYQCLNYSKVANRGSEYGFLGVFDGCGYTIDFNNLAIFKNSSGYERDGLGMFGNFVHGGGGACYPQVAITVKDVALINWKQNFAPILGAYTKVVHNYDGLYSYFENIYVTVNDTIVSYGLFKDIGSYTKVNNVLVDMEGNGNTNTAYADKVQFGDLGDGVFPYGSGYASGTLCLGLRSMGATAANNITNFVSLGKTSIVENAAAKDHYYRFFSSTETDGVYTFNLLSTGWNGAGTQYIIAKTETYYGYAGGNRTRGDQAIMTGIKPAFYEIAKNHPLPTYVNSSTTNDKLAGFYCATCGNTFSLEAGTCATCSTAEAPVALTEKDNLWALPHCFTWRVLEFGEGSNYQNPASTENHGEIVFYGAYKYDTTAEMKASGNTFDSFVGEQGKGLWSVVGGKLTWVGNQVA